MSAVSAAPATRVGMWRAVASGWRVIVAVVLADAAMQTLLVVPDPVPALTFGFCALVVGSALAVLVAVWLTVCAASASVDGVPRQALARARQRPGVLAWALGIGLLAVGASLLEVWLGAVVLVIGAFVLPSAAAGAGDVLATAYRTIVRAPIRSVAAIAGAFVAVALSWVLALALGFFVTGTLAAAVTWLWFGLISTLLLVLFCSLYAVCLPARSTTISSAHTRPRGT